MQMLVKRAIQPCTACGGAQFQGLPVQTAVVMLLALELEVAA